MMIRSRKRRAVFMVVIAALLAACGDDDDSSAGIGPTGEESTAEGSTGGDGDVTQTLRIGYAYSDLEQFAEANPAFGTGDNEEQIQAVIDGWRAEGRLPVNGVDIELVVRSFDITDDATALAACQAFAEEDEVFAVIAGRDFTAGAECLADRFDTPVISTNSAVDEVYEVGSPWFFSMRASEADAARSFVAWADEEGLLDNPIGLFWDNGSTPTIAVLRDEIVALGHDIVADVETGGEGFGSNQDQVAVQQFMDAGAEVAILPVGSTNIAAFATFAEEQGYAPTYIDWDFGSHLSDVAGMVRPPEQLEGVRGLAMSRIGDLGAEDLSEEAEACVGSYEGYSGETLERVPPEDGAWSNILITCSLGEVLLEAIGRAAEEGEVTPDSLVAALESIEDFPTAYWENITFGPNDHAGAQSSRAVEWDVSCACFIPTDGAEFQTA